MNEEYIEIPKVDPGPQMVSWLTYLDSRLEAQDKHSSAQWDEASRQFAHYESLFDKIERRFDKLEDLIRETRNDSAATREQVARNGVIAGFVSAMVAFGSRYFGQ